jgi:hypothetical protein
VPRRQAGSVGIATRAVPCHVTMAGKRAERRYAREALRLRKALRELCWRRTRGQTVDETGVAYPRKRVMGAIERQSHPYQQR